MKQLRGTPLKRFLRDFKRANPVTHELALVLQSVMYPVNVGSLFRIADAVGLQQMYLCGITETPPHPTIGKVGRGKHTSVSWQYEKEAEEVLEQLRADGYHICALEITDASVPYYEVAYPRKVAFIAGNEDHGVTRSALALCDSSVFVPMYGRGRSLNVHVSAAIVLYHVLQHQIDDGLEPLANS